MPESTPADEARNDKAGGRPAAVTVGRPASPDWLQSVLTLGGVTLATSLYLGAQTGVGLLWLPPVAMILGIVMLAAIVYVTRNTGQRPLKAINRHINPVLGWGWALGALAASILWCLPQYSLASGALQQNLMPSVLGEGSRLGTTVGTWLFNLLPGLKNAGFEVGDFGGKVIISAVILLLTVLLTWVYDSGGWGTRLCEMLLKLVVAALVACFVGVVCVLGCSGKLNWGQVFWGFVPDLTRLWNPAGSLNSLLDKVPPGYRSFWENRLDLIVEQHRSVAISAAATAVAINVTFLLPYSMLRRGRGEGFRGLARFNLPAGIFVLFLLATSCVVIASATRFYPRDADFNQPKPEGEARSGLPEKVLQDIHKARLIYVFGKDQYEILTGAKGGFPPALYIEGHHDKLTPAELMLAAHLYTRDARALSAAVAPLTGRVAADYVFGIGVVGMTLLSLILLTRICGLVICEMFGAGPEGWPNRLACLAAAAGVLGPFVWAERARFWLAVPTSVFCFTLLPLAYVTFLWMMNSKSLLGERMPRGGKRVAWNLAMGIAAGVATAASAYVVWLKTKELSMQYIGNNTGGLALICGLVLLVVIVHSVFPRKATTNGN